jgi:alpha-mannosidase
VLFRSRRSDLLLTAFGKNPDGAGTLLRFWEMTGSSQDCVVSLPEGIKAASVQPVNLRGIPLGAPIKIENHSFVYPVQPFAPMSFVLPE